MNQKDINIAAGWTGEADFIAVLIAVGFLDKLKNGLYRLHNWKKRQPWVAGFPERSQRAKYAAKQKRTKGGNKLQLTETKIGNNQKGNGMPQKPATPSPSPTPLPPPLPTPSPNSKKEESSGKPDSPPPISKREPDRQFRVWFESPKGQGYISKLCQKLGWIMPRMEALSHDAEMWLANPDNPKRFKKDWGRFWKNWVDKHIEIQSDRKRKAEFTAQNEKDHYAGHGGGQRGGGFKKIGDP